MANPKLTILTFPQQLQGNVLTFNALIIPRNIDPLQALVTGLGGGVPDAPSFSAANLIMEAKVIDNLADFPSDLVTSTVFPLTGTGIPATATDIFTSLATEFKITITNDSAPGPLTNLYIKKYLPLSYRNAFNFTNPVRNAVIDDSYECAVRNGEKNPAFKRSPKHDVSWGQVFAYILRQPDLARAAGFLQSSSITLTPDLYKNGGWLYIDIAPTSDFYAQYQVQPDLIKKYAARIPALTIGNNRNIFAAIQFPVLTAFSPTPAGTFDQIFIEASEYDTGFAKIVHTYQPVNGNLIKETEDPESLPRKDLGVRMGWDDEQLLIWQNRQMAEDADQLPGSGVRTDAPMGVSKYRIDARLSVPSGDAVNPWTSLAKVRATKNLSLGSVPLTAKDTELEFGTEVYPSQLDGDQTANFWLPSYFTQWTGRSLVLPDAEGAILNHAAKAGVKINDTYRGVGLRQDKITKVPVGGVEVLKIADAPDPAGEPSLDLRYGQSYDFRVRLADFTGGGPLSTDEPDPDNQGPAPVSTIQFKRYIAPNQVIFPDNTGDGTNFTGTSINIQRPRLGYPAVVFTGKYTDPITLLQQDADNATSVPIPGHVNGGLPGRDFGLPDPDVINVQITVEVKSLLMDNQLSANGREAYVQLYQTNRAFPADYNQALDIAIQFVDANVLSLGDPTDLLPLGLSPGEIDTMAGIVLPTSRDIRITLIAVCDADLNYFGSNLSYNGLPISFLMRQESSVETNMFVGTGAEEQLQAIYLQPDAPMLAVNKTTSPFILLGDLNNTNPPDMIQRFASQAGILNKNYTLVGQPGRQIQFGASQNIRHSLSPDSSNITISTKADLLNHWLVAIKLILNRDWSWDRLATNSFKISRVMKFKADGPITAADPSEDVGYIQLGNSANINSLINPDRSSFDLMFIDAVEPKPLGNNFPDIIELQYTIKPQFTPLIANPTADAPLVLNISLPVTTNPSQIPELASAGIALSPYISKDNYSATEAREKYLWLEFKDPPADPNDSFYIRLLNYAPDPLLANMSLELLENTQEPTLPIDPELIRVISSGNDTDDKAGLSAMQEMIAATGSNKHFLIPLPPGLNSSSPELFGMFTYEIRAGHKLIWSTAQGRFGRPLRATGVQHPAPTLFCTVSRNEFVISVTAPHAVAVLNGRNVTAKPPKTEIWALIYAQVIQADGASYRNILLNDKMLTPVYSNEKIKINKDAPVYSATTWPNIEIEQILALMGLPIDSPLSVLCVEMMPKPETYLDLIKELDDSIIEEWVKEPQKEVMSKFMETKQLDKQTASPVFDVSDNPLSTSLGKYRILRTSPLTKVPFICCTS